MPQVEGPGGAGDRRHPGSGSGGSRGHGWGKSTLGAKGSCWGGLGAQGSGGRVGGSPQQRRRRKAGDDGLAGSAGCLAFSLLTLG